MTDVLLRRADPFVLSQAQPPAQRILSRQWAALVQWRIELLWFHSRDGLEDSVCDRCDWQTWNGIKNSSTLLSEAAYNLPNSPALDFTHLLNLRCSVFYTLCLLCGGGVDDLGVDGKQGAELLVRLYLIESLRFLLARYRANNCALVITYRIGWAKFFHRCSNCCSEICLVSCLSLLGR